MPIKIPNDLPATKTLTDENIFVMTENRAIKQDIRPLQILLPKLLRMVKRFIMPQYLPETVLKLKAIKRISEINPPHED